jgi:predicted enzyme involved in methoxymalonyl-ACP biosynthesis
MTTYAHVENNTIQGVYDKLPKNWRNISNFYLLTDQEIENFGWLKIIKTIPDINTVTQKIDNFRYELIDGKVFERYDILEIETTISLPSVDLDEILAKQELEKIKQWNKVRENRDHLMREFEWRYTRHYRQIRMELEPTDSIESLDEYMQSLADITLQEDPFNISWPEFQ